MSRLIFLCMVISCVSVTLALSAKAESNTNQTKTYTLGIVPQQAASKLARDWVPLLQKISKDSGVSLKFKTAPNIPEFEKKLAQGEYDFAYMNPYHYVVFSETSGYRALAKQKYKQIQGIFVTAIDSGIESLEELKGKELAFPSPGAFAASILTRGFLSQIGVDFIPVYVKSHDSVYRNVASKKFIAGGGITRTLSAAPATVQKDLKVLWTSPKYTPHAFAAHERVPTEVVGIMQRAMEAIHTTAEGEKLLAPLKFKAIERAQDKQWDDVRTLGINPREVIAGIKSE